MQLKAPAKINLSFEIKARRPDGFHEIETLMAPLSLADQIHLETDRTFEGVQFSCDDPSLPDDENNLVVRAARNFQRKTGSRVGLKITLQKNIPHGAGLGGGSSDAATTLLGLNKLLGAELAQSELVKLAAEIGSDVPFFLFGSAAICEGRGEFVKPSPLTRHFTILLLKPDFGVPTPWAYKGWSSSRELPGVDMRRRNFPASVL